MQWGYVGEMMSNVEQIYMTLRSIITKRKKGITLPFKDNELHLTLYLTTLSIIVHYTPRKHYTERRKNFTLRNRTDKITIRHKSELKRQGHTSTKTSELQRMRKTVYIVTTHRGILHCPHSLNCYISHTYTPAIRQP